MASGGIAATPRTRLWDRNRANNRFEPIFADRRPLPIDQVNMRAPVPATFQDSAMIVLHFGAKDFTARLIENHNHNSATP